MRRLGRKGTSIIGIAGCLLLVAAVLASHLWFYVLAPWRRVSSYEWRLDHSRARLWEEDQKNICRFMWYHDTYASRYGTKETAKWLIGRMEPGDDIRSCAAGHKHEALQNITNQDGEDAAAWIVWWTEHSGESQAEWVREGFVPYGIETLTTSPGTNGMVKLLNLMGNTATNASGTPAVLEQA